MILLVLALFVIFCLSFLLLVGSLLCRWFMPVNILITFVIGSALGWLLIKLTRSPRHLKGLIIGSCSAECSFEAPESQILVSSSNSMTKIPLSRRIAQCITKFAEKTNLDALLSPSTIAARSISPNSDVNNRSKSSSSSMKLRVVMGIMAVRYIILPLLGIVIVKGAIHFRLVPVDPLFLFVLLLQYALPPAMNIGTMTQLFGAGQGECSVIMLWTYASASIVLAFWSTVYLWLVAS
ncbi:hypothetical protein Cgig2_006301 [Carnegiea gigantea]|uniref:PIN-like protein n=1 Tax=Carnegiea gigantea TaxID=171969 RepID=A0A9Q1K7T0_9CARY|nr:hypothetical protein Cgig2_006301 [Carnegiea gigantea]